MEMTFEVQETTLDGVLIIKPTVFEDPRGFFFESFNQKEFESSTGVHHRFVQDNHSISYINVLRGLHYQLDNPQGKLVRLTLGEVFDVCVNIQPKHPQFMSWLGIYLKAEENTQIWIPPGFAHGYAVLSERAELLYKTTDYYSPGDERSIIWNDPDLKITWPLRKQPILSAKDAAASTMQRAELPTIFK